LENLLTLTTLIQAFKHSSIQALCSKGSAEDELGDGVARLAKLRPMRVEMYL